MVSGNEGKSVAVDKLQQVVFVLSYAIDKLRVNRRLQLRV